MKLIVTCTEKMTHSYPCAAIDAATSYGFAIFSAQF
jgi:hypothetical protein